MKHFPDTFALFPEAQQRVDQLVAEEAVFGCLHAARLPCVLSQRALVERGRAEPGIVLDPNSGFNSSARRNLADWLLAQFVVGLCDGHEPDFILVFDVALWPAAEAERLHLLFHLLCHIEQRTDEYGAPKFNDAGFPALRLRRHDIERFNAELLRFGSVIAGFDDEHGVYAAARQREQRTRLKLA